MSSRSGSSDNSGISRVIRPVAVSTVIGAASCIVILLLCSLLMSTRSIPQSVIDPMAIFAISVGGLVSGLCCAKIMRENGLLMGAVCGAVLTIIVLIGGLIFSDSGFGVPAIFKIVFIMLCAMLGGVMGVNTKKRRK